MQLEELKPGVQIEGLIPGQVVVVLAVNWHGTQAIELTFKTNSGSIHQQVVFRDDQKTLSLAELGNRSFDAPASDFKLVAEAQRITLAGLFDPMLAVATSEVQPLPHQIQAVYGEMLPRTPLRFLLADDPGAGKTIMAGLYIKELILRDDIKHCLIIAPGGLVEQWQDELFFKFGLDFRILTNQVIDANVNVNVFDSHSLLIARMDQLSRNEYLQQQLAETEWDLIVVDEAHRMGAHYYGNELKKTKRFLLGEMLGQITRHLLLMTATPHSGIEENFQLFLTLLDRDRFEGKQKETVDVSGIMRRMVKEDLLTFEGKRLFPERIAETVPYELTALEFELYEQVTAYVREGMNRADRIGGKQKNTVGFALTVLQRRLASSPEAIYKSLVRRAERLQKKRQLIIDGTLPQPIISGEFPDIDLAVIDEDEYSAADLEVMEEELLDSATAAQTIEELDAELIELHSLTELAQKVRQAGTDRKWTELSNILQDHALFTDSNGWPRKIIIFTEHRDTLDYLQAKISSLLGRPGAVKAIHGGVRRSERRQITEEFTKNREVQILIATDAAGEGLNLQAAHLMVNYDLPWNPNRIEQRFGRIHRIGQEEVCRLWNLVASNTREGEVFTRLLMKLEQMRQTYGGKVFDVLGEAFNETPLRQLLLEAIQYGERADVKARMHQVIDSSVGDGLVDLIAERALATEHLAEADVQALKIAMDEAKARRLQPHYIAAAFKEALHRLGGRMVKRELGRYEIVNVPPEVLGAGKGPISRKYDRVTFDLDHVTHDSGVRADLIAPGHPLHDAVMGEIIRRFSNSLQQGSVLVSSKIEEPHLLVGVVEEVADAASETVARRFGYAFVASDGTVTPAGPAPYLDCDPAPDNSATSSARKLKWLSEAEEKVKSWMITHQLPEYLSEIQRRRLAELEKAEQLIKKRLAGERDRLAFESVIAAEKEASGTKVKESSASLTRKAMEIDSRLDRRVELLNRQKQMSIKPPSIVTAALVLPVSMFEQELPQDAPLHAAETKEVERRGVDLVMQRERELGRNPIEQAFNNPGFDILSNERSGTFLRIEVKARIVGAIDFFITKNEVFTAKNSDPNYRLALVKVDPRGTEYDEVRYLENPFAKTELGNFDATGIRGDWEKMWEKGRAPF